MTYHNGWDIVHLPVGKCDFVACRVCKTEMKKSTEDSPQNFVEAIGGSKHKHDAFRCPFAGEDWHEQAYLLFRDALATPSKWLGDKLEEEALEIVKIRKCTKERV